MGVQFCILRKLDGMMERALVLDANILIRAVLGRRVRDLIIAHHRRVQFFAPSVAYEDARRHLPPILTRRGVDATQVMQVLDGLKGFVFCIQPEFFSGMRCEAQLRISVRDIEDWPVLALAMTLDCPIWTEDADFFGAGVPTWTTDRVERYFT